MAQTTTPASPTFEVASIKPGDPNATNVRVNIAPGGKFTATNATVRMLVRQAFDLRDSQISGGPKWLDTDRFDIEAKPADGVNIPSGPGAGEVLSPMLRSLLMERFGLTFHHETREESVYQLVVDKGGSKLKATRPRKGGPQGLRAARGRLTGMAAPVSMLANNLWQQLGRLVLDKTGLKDTYDFTLEYAPDPGGAVVTDANPADAPLPSIFTALQEQLGLKLESARGPVEILVIDHADKPTAN
jgi:uncharacterized protein (TIGR03435 family)